MIYVMPDTAYVATLHPNTEVVEVTKRNLNELDAILPAKQFLFIFNHKFNDKPDHLCYTDARNQEQSLLQKGNRS